MVLRRYVEMYVFRYLFIGISTLYVDILLYSVTYYLLCTWFILIQENIGKVFNEIVQFNAGSQQKGGGSGFGLWSKLVIFMMRFYFYI